MSPGRLSDGDSKDRYKLQRINSVFVTCQGVASRRSACAGNGTACQSPENAGMREFGLFVAAETAWYFFGKALEVIWPGELPIRDILLGGGASIAAMYALWTIPVDGLRWMPLKRDLDSAFSRFMNRLFPALLMVGLLLVVLTEIAGGAL